MHYISDNQKLIDECFEFDWAHNKKIPTKIKDETDFANVRKFFKERYKDIKNIYKFYATKSPVDDIWSI